jgi:cytochrome c biogenesis protein CcmG/thiol:disulfide interchange protein DsbE
MKRKLILWLPFVLLMALFISFYVGLKNPSDRIIASQLVGQPLPDFAAAAVVPGMPGTAATDFRDGKPRLLNIFASWCVPCVAEIPMLQRLKMQGVEIGGIAVHDTPQDLEKFLGENGNPYSRIGLDGTGRAQLTFGSSGVPETFVIDGKGNVIHQHIGVVTESDIPRLIAMLGGAK